MSATITVKTKLTDRQYLIAALKKAMKDIFPNCNADDIQLAQDQKSKLTLQMWNGKTAKGDIRVRKGLATRDNQVLLITDKGQKIIYNSEEEARKDAASKKINIKSITRAPYQYADMGYTIQPDGTFSKVMDDMDGKLFGEEFDKRVQAYYDGMKLLKQATTKGLTIKNANMQSTGAQTAVVEMEITEEQLMQLTRQQQVVVQRI